MPPPQPWRRPSGPTRSSWARGWAARQGSLDVAVRLVEELPVPLVVDADALYALAGAGLERVAARRAPTVLTPHAGELARLVGRLVRRRCGAPDRIGARRRGARGVPVVLKGDDTLVVDPQGPLAVSEGNCPALATAGTGDVLSGVMAAFMARGIEPFTAACAAVYAHVEAAACRGPAAGGRFGDRE